MGQIGGHWVLFGLEAKKILQCEDCDAEGREEKNPEAVPRGLVLPLTLGIHACKLHVFLFFFFFNTVEYESV